MPEMLRSLQYMADPLRLRVLEGLHELIADRSINFAFSKDNDPLGAMVRTIDWNVHNVQLSPAAATALGELRSAIIERQRARPKAAAAQPKRAAASAEGAKAA